MDLLTLSSRPRLFRKRQRLRLRHIVYSTAILAALWGTVSLFDSGENTTNTITVANAATGLQTEAVTASAITTHETVTEQKSASVTMNLKSAFEQAPPAPGYDYAAAQLAEIEPAAGDGKPVENPQAFVEQKVAMLHSGLSSLLQTGEKVAVAEKKVSVGRGDTLMELLVSKADVPRGEAYQAIQALSKVYDPRALRPDNEITVFFHKNPKIADPMFGGLTIEQDMINSVVVNRLDTGEFSVEEKQKPVHKSLKAYSGTIDSSLYLSAKSVGIPDAVIISMIRMYSWNVDFQRDIQSGDEFEIMYEEYATEDGQIVPGKGDIVYARMNLSGRDMPFYRYEDSEGEVGYYDRNGQSARKALMKTPIDGARLSSGFGMRHHPVLGYSRMHKGTDFAAPRGTPIYAAGDGVIERIGPFSSYGNYIKIRHRSDLHTAYAHMKGFKRGLSRGSRVKQGEIIGYVGTTGRSTGPHLHYEVLLNDRQVNPNKIKMPTGKKLKGQDLEVFQTLLAKMDGEFDRLNGATAVAQKTSATLNK